MEREEQSELQTRNFHYYLDNQSNFVSKYNGKVLLIVGQKVVGVYDSEKDAYFDAITKYEPGTFLIQLCTEGDSAYTQVFHSNVVFA